VLSAVGFFIDNLVALANHGGDEVGFVSLAVDFDHHIEGVLRWAAEVEYLVHVIVVKTARRRFRLLKPHQLTLELSRVDTTISPALLCYKLCCLFVALVAN